MNRISVLIPDADAKLPVVRCLGASKCAVVHGFALHPAPFLEHSRFLASFEQFKGEFDVKLWLSRIGEIVAERRIDVVLPISEFAIRTLSEHRQALTLGREAAAIAGSAYLRYRHGQGEPGGFPRQSWHTSSADSGGDHRHRGAWQAFSARVSGLG